MNSKCKYPISIRLVLSALLAFIFISNSCTNNENEKRVIHVNGFDTQNFGEIWLSHEHILVDFIGADSIDKTDWNHDSVITVILPFLEEVKKKGVDYFVDATPAYLGRDVELLQKISERTGLKIITNTGFYGARNNKFIPKDAFGKNAKELADIWIDEFENGIDKSGIKPGFIKIGVDDSEVLDTMHQKLVRAAALTHLNTGLTIASHTGKAIGIWPQFEILEEEGVSLESFIWVHAQNEEDHSNYVKAAEKGCWISLDGLGWETENHIKKLLFAKENDILDHVLISHDAGWYDPQKPQQEIQPFSNIFDVLIPSLQSSGFSDEEINLLMSDNPSKAYAIKLLK